MLTHAGLVESRSKAKTLIEGGAVTLEEERFTNPNAKFIVCKVVDGAEAKLESEEYIGLFDEPLIVHYGKRKWAKLTFNGYPPSDQV